MTNLLSRGLIGSLLALLCSFPSAALASSRATVHKGDGFACPRDSVFTVQRVGDGGWIHELKPDPGDQNGGCPTHLGQRIPVILIHGLNRCSSMPSPEVWDNFAKTIGHSDTFKLYRFSWWSNIEPISSIGGYLRDVLDALDDDPDAGFRSRQVIIITHSAGGLIARSYMQEWRSRSNYPYGGHADLGGERVSRLITLATPHRGSPLANGPYRIEYVRLWEREHNGDWSNSSRFGDYWLQCPIPNSFRYDTYTRLDIHWDNSTPLFPYGSVPPSVPGFGVLVPESFINDTSDWLQKLNCVPPFGRSTGNPQCGVLDRYAPKIIAYAGKAVGVSANYWDAKSICDQRHLENSNAGNLCVIQSYLNAVFQLDGDGFVPYESATFNSGAWRIKTRDFWFYNHEDMILGKTSPSDERLFLDLRGDLQNAVPDGPQANLTMTYGAAVGTETTPLTVNVSAGGSATVVLSSAGSTTYNGPPESYHWFVDNVSISTDASTPHALTAGRHRVALWIFDNLGARGEAFGSVTVKETYVAKLWPVATTTAASSVTSNIAVLNGRVTPNGTWARVWFQWGTSASPYANSTPADTLTSDEPTSYAHALPNLLPNTTYHFRVVAENETALKWGDDQTFTTKSAPDQEAPQVGITSPTTYVTTSQYITLGGWATDDLGVTSVTWGNDQGGTGTATGTASWTTSSIPLARGDNVITVTAWDGTGKSGTDMLTVTSNPPDNVSPDTQILSGPSGTWTSSDFTFTWTGSDDVTAPANLRYTTHLEGFDLSSTPYASTTSRSFSGIPNGTYTFWVRARDEVDNIDYSAATRTFTVSIPDTTAPSVANVLLTGGGVNNLFRTGQANSIVFDATDNIRPTEADLYYSIDGGASWISIVSSFPIRSGQNSFQWTVPAAAITTNGKIRVVVRDAAGNPAEGLFGPFTIIDGTPPRVKVISPNGGEDWPLGTSQTIRWEASGTYPIDGFIVYFLRDGSTLYIGGFPGNQTTYQWTLPVTGSTERALVRVVARDTYGNESEDFSDGLFRMSNPDKPPPPPWHVPSLVSSTAGYSPQPVVAMDRFGKVHLAAASGNSTQQQVVYRLWDAGAWGTRKEITSYPVDSQANEHYTDWVRIAVDSSGHPHVIWLRGRNLPYPSYDDDLFYSYFDGTSWSSPVNLSASVTSGGSSSTRYPAMAVDSGDRVHVVWMERIVGISGPSGHLVYHAIKTGGTWAPPVPITLSGSAQYYSYAEMVGDRAGRIHLITSADGNERIDHSVFDGAGWASQPIVPSENGFSAQRGSVTLGADDTLHAAWFNAARDADGHEALSLQYSSYRNGVWASAIAHPVPDWKAAQSLAIAMNALGRSVISWIQDSPVPPNGIAFVYASEITDRGWSEPIRISDRTTNVSWGQPISMAGGPSGTHVVWQGTGGVIWNWADYSAMLNVVPAEIVFPSIGVGETAEAEFLLLNPTSGAASGSATVGPAGGGAAAVDEGQAAVSVPFSITSGAQFSVGAGDQIGSVTVRFAPTAVGAASGTVTFSTPWGDITRTVSGDATATAHVVGSAMLQGRPAQPDPRWSVWLSVSLTTPGVQTPAYEFTTATDENGAFVVSGIAPGTYDVRVKNSHTLRNTQTVTFLQGQNTVSFGTLREGDANGDNFVTVTDFSTLVSTFAKCDGDAGYDSRADFNNDGCVTLLDFSLLAANFGQAGAP